MKPSRASMLPVLQFCGWAAELAERYPSGLRAGVKGTYLHAVISKDPRAAELRARLTPEEAAECDKAVAPAPLVVDGLPSLLWDVGAEHEVELGMSAGGRAVPFAEADLYTGHLDAMWDCASENTVVIADLKTGTSTAPGGAMSLQLLAYGFCAAAAKGRRYFLTAVWYAHPERARWSIGERVDTESEEGMELWLRVKSAALAERTAIKGDHCLEACFNREHCHQWLMPSEAGWPELEKSDPTDEELWAAYIRWEAAKEAAAKVESILKGHAEKRGGLRGGGFEWAPIRCAGKAGLDKEALERDGLLEKYTTKGAPYTMFKRRKAQ